MQNCGVFENVVGPRTRSHAKPGTGCLGQWDAEKDMAEIVDDRE